MHSNIHILNIPLSQEKQNQSKDTTRSALNHWFARNRGVQRNGWPVTYESTYHMESFCCPPGIDETYWDTLTHAEKRWNATPVKNQSCEDKKQPWQEQAISQIIRDARRAAADYYEQAVKPADPFEAPIQLHGKSATSQNNENVVPFPTAQAPWKQAENW
jgi:hypothetical protein